MKYYVVLSFVIGYLCLTVSGTTDKTFNSPTNAETSSNNTTNVESSFTNATYVGESSSNATNLKESSKNATDLEAFSYVIENETESKLQHGIKSKITGGFKKIGSKIKNIGTKVKNKITGTGSGSGNGNSGSHITHGRIIRNNSKNKSGTVDVIYISIFFGILGICILGPVVFYSVACILEKKKKSGSSSKESEVVTQL